MDTYKSIILSLTILGSTCYIVKGAVPVLYNFNTNHFETNASPWRIALKTSIVDTVTAPFIDLEEYWYDPFAGFNNGSAGTIGTLGWEAQSGGVGGGVINVTNAPGHFGILEISTSDIATSMRGIYLSEEHNSKPSIPPVATSIWTNRIVWRAITTNDVRIYLVLNNGDITHNSVLNQSCGFFFDTNSNQIKGYSNTTGTPQTTNLITMQNEVWYTNTMWCEGDSVLRFRVNDGPLAATLSGKIPTTGLTPKVGIVKTVGGVISYVQVDSWFLRPEQ